MSGSTCRPVRSGCSPSAGRPCSPATSSTAVPTGRCWTGWASCATAGWTPGTWPGSTTDGFVHLAGRAKDLIIRGGHNIDPAVIENALLAHPAVTAAQAVGRPDVHAGEVPVAFVTLAPGANATPEELRAWASDHVPEQAAAPKAVTVLDTLPVTPVGKPFKPALRAEATREAVADALRDMPAVTGVRGVVEDGAVVAVVGLARGADETSVTEALDRFAITWRLELS